jgi:hypothetical protein
MRTKLIITNFLDEITKESKGFHSSQEEPNGIYVNLFLNQDPKFENMCIFVETIPTKQSLKLKN